MTTAPLAHTDVIVLDYLAALWAQSDDLDPGLRDELMTTVADYIAARRSAAVGPVEDASAIVRRLGPPEALVEAARRGHVPPHIRLPALVPPPPLPAPVAPAGPGGALEYTTLGLLTAGAVILPVVGPTAGMLLATGSTHWTPVLKVAGWILTAGSAAAGMILVLLCAAVGAGGGAALLIGYLAVCVGPLMAAAMLFSGRRA
jgi:hypothetical protein